MTRLSCHLFRSNEVRLWLSVIAYNLGNLRRQLVLPHRIDNWSLTSLTSLQQRLVKTRRLVEHVRYYWLSWPRASTKRLFGPWYGGSACCPCERVRGRRPSGFQWARRQGWEKCRRKSSKEPVSGFGILMRGQLALPWLVSARITATA